MTIPDTGSLDSTLAFLRDGYLFGTNRFEGLGGDRFMTRLMAKPAIVAFGADAAEIFYGGDRFGRERAMPTTVVRLLQDVGSVQSLSGDAHLHRKAMFVRLLMDDAAIAEVDRLTREEWNRAAAAWDRPVRLYDELSGILTRVALRWVGIDPATVAVDRLAAGLTGMIEGAGSVGVRNLAEQLRRRRVERWAGQAIERARWGHRAITPASPVHGIASHRDEHGELLSIEIAAVELINVLRPVVAVGRFIVFAAHALDQHPEWRSRLADEPERIESFVHEVRRLYPFFPLVGGRARREFTWRDTLVREGDWMLLDLYATNHDARLWRDPERFAPERFDDWDGDEHTLIPQGAGDAETGHRCPGERATIAIMTAAVHELVTMSWRLPQQDLSISLRSFPALPKDRLVFERTDVTPKRAPLA